MGEMCQQAREYDDGESQNAGQQNRKQGDREGPVENQAADKGASPRTGGRITMSGASAERRMNYVGRSLITSTNSPSCTTTSC